MHAGPQTHGRFAPESAWGLAVNNPIFPGHLPSGQKHLGTMFRPVCMEYRCVATSVIGLVQQLVSCYLPHGYWFYVSGVVPAGKAPEAVDAKLIEKYRIGISPQSRARRKAAGLANMQYIRHERRFLLLATHGHHTFYAEEGKNIRDVRRVPIKVAGYSVSVAKGGFKGKRFTEGALVRDEKWRVRVQIEKEWYLGLKAYLLDIALHRSAAELAAEFYTLPFEPYAPIRQQLLNLLRYTNRRRECAQLKTLCHKVLRYRRRIVHPFEPVEPSEVVGPMAVNVTDY